MVEKEHRGMVGLMDSMGGGLCWAGLGDSFLSVVNKPSVISSGLSTGQTPAVVGGGWLIVRRTRVRTHTHMYGE